MFPSAIHVSQARRTQIYLFLCLWRLTRCSSILMNSLNHTKFMPGEVIYKDKTVCSATPSSHFNFTAVSPSPTPPSLSSRSYLDNDIKSH